MRCLARMLSVGRIKGGVLGILFIMNLIFRLLYVGHIIIFSLQVHQPSLSISIHSNSFGQLPTVWTSILTCVV
jgi:hypothetical protein